MTLALQVDDQVNRRADALLERMAKDSRLATRHGTLRRADIFRLALDEGLAVLEERYQVSPEGSPPDRDVE